MNLKNKEIQGTKVTIKKYKQMQRIKPFRKKLSSELGRLGCSYLLDWMGQW